MNIEWKGVMPAVTTKFLDNQDLDLNNFTINLCIFPHKNVFLYTIKIKISTIIWI